MRARQNRLAACRRLMSSAWEKVERFGAETNGGVYLRAAVDATLTYRGVRDGQL